MTANETKKQQVIEGFRLHDADSGSVELQVALLSERIGHLTEHCKISSKDFASRRGLLKLVNRRRSFLNYIKSKDENSYKNLVERLGLRK